MDTSCTRFRPVYMKATDSVDEETAKAILANNRAGQAKCGWKPIQKAPK